MKNQQNSIQNVCETLVCLLEESCIDLFSSYDINITYNKNLNLAEEGTNLISLIGLSEEYFRSSLTLCISHSLLKASFPASEKNITENDLKDWLGELANQLAGRFKNKIIPYGRKLELGIPTVIQGSHLKWDVPKCSNVSKHQFVTEDGDVVELNFSMLINDHFKMHMPEETGELLCLAEGDMLFF